MLSGLMSPCEMPRECAQCRAIPQVPRHLAVSTKLSVVLLTVQYAAENSYQLFRAFKAVQRSSSICEYRHLPPQAPLAVFVEVANCRVQCHS